MKRQRGSILLYLLLAVALAGFGAMIVHSLYMAGVNAERAAQAKRDREAEQKAAERRAVRKKMITKAAGELEAARAEADDYRARWRKEKTRAGTLVSCTPAAPGAPAAAPLVRFTPDFLRLWDGAWTGPGGQPVFGDRGELAAGAAPAGVDQVGPDQLLDNHEENAARCSANARQLGKLVEVIKRLRSQPTPCATSP